MKKNLFLGALIRGDQKFWLPDSVTVSFLWGHFHYQSHHFPQKLNNDLHNFTLSFKLILKTPLVTVNLLVALAADKSMADLVWTSWRKWRDERILVTFTQLLEDGSKKSDLNCCTRTVKQWWVWMLLPAAVTLKWRPLLSCEHSYSSVFLILTSW